MRRRSSTSGKPLKAGRKTTAPKRPNPPRAARPRESSAAGEEAEVARLRRELNELLEQQAATSEVLRVINSSPGDLKPVFEAMLENAVRLCEAKFGFMMRYDGDAFHVMAQVGAAPAYADIASRGPLRPGPETILGQVLSRKQEVQIPDLAATRGYAERSPLMVAAVELGGVRTYLAVPMFKENKIIGAVLLYRQEVRPFNGKQVALLMSFAAQAAIAIENTRLLNELRHRTDDLTESLEQQTATSEVLRLISSSPGELQPVFDAMLASAVSICQARFGVLHRFDGDEFYPAAMLNAPPELEDFLRKFVGRRKPTPGGDMEHLYRSKQVVHTIDMLKSPSPSPPAKLAGARTQLAVPMVKDEELIGAIIIYRQEVQPFTEKQIELVKNFAAQAVIAIENARLLNELKKLNMQLEQRVEDQVGEIERMSKLRRFLPPQVADLIVASGTEKQLESHRREITALFCDLRGFTGFSESADPEDVMALLREYHAAIGEIIIKYSGTLERYAGDGVMVIFNDPVPVPNPALQAVKMALDMRVRVGALIEKWRRLDHELGFGIGIAHGFATLGTIGFEGRFDYAAIGTVSNVASRLCDEAKPGQILISPRVLMAVEKDVTVEPVGEFTLKGIRRPMSTYNVQALATPKTSHA
jgi:class 3 adenylate cyclase/putative methionine-R-sulfoxide reductase with GAF domain